MRPAAVGKKLFLWREVLVLMDSSLLPEGSDSNSLCPIFPARFKVLEAYRSWRDGRLQPITFSAERTVSCSLSLRWTQWWRCRSAHHCLRQVEFLQLPQEVHPLMCFFGVQLPLKALGYDGPQEAEGLHSVNWSTGVPHRVMGAGGAGFLL